MKIRKKIVILLHFILVFFVSQELKALSLQTIGDELDTILIPSSYLYQNTWGGENTRLRTNLLSASQNYVLPLQKGEGEEDIFVFPCVNKTYVCSFYGIRNGRMHTGMDIKQNLGDSIVAAWDGIVRMAQKNYYAYGGTVVIRHPNGLETLYAHLSKINVTENQPVKAGELIGHAGRTGRATTEHLHFETRFLYEHFDPQIIIDFKTFSLNSDTLYISKGKFFNKSPLMQDFMEIEDVDSLNVTNLANHSLEQENQPVQEIIVETPKKPALQDTYIIKKGDTLYAIAKRYKVEINDLCLLNNINQKSILQIGQRLKLK
ncbi:MAG: peptidoglycan DD-metalloendopeptidase family protein [Bacteroidales bacterium]|jgi:murein DD-endopeptidase MepM/ murein hydrolase activator NlpD|nr:peptidoglycan DD-metalloendopeptidase family protein [Bacteroidales bacterium]